MTDADTPRTYARRRVLQGASVLGGLVAAGVKPTAAATTESTPTGFGTGGYGAGRYGGTTQSQVGRFDTNGTPGIQRSEVLAAITAYDNQERIGGQTVTADDVMAVIAAYNA
ncbi:hypothetical protein [Haloarcula halophila]|uniref:hypothetical protein n=1 Tax=Haloarcula TaxID=2237 RepID=UPI0023E35826|nr:hypothetical protein [Halomicroarcula sp. DFY41]